MNMVAPKAKVGRPKARKDIRPILEGGLKRAFILMEESGKPISSIWTRMFEDDPVNAMRLAISLVPKELDVDISGQVSIDTTMIDPASLERAIEYRRLAAIEAAKIEIEAEWEDVSNPTS